MVTDWLNISGLGFLLGLHEVPIGAAVISKLHVGILVSELTYGLLKTGRSLIL